VEGASGAGDVALGAEAPGAGAQTTRDVALTEGALGDDGWRG
jgi:hypothetical protein